MLLRAAASNLQDLHRGLEGKSLSRQAAGSLLDAAGLALETASDLEASEIACQDKVVPGEDPDHLACYTSTGNPLVSEKRAFRKRRPRLPRSALLVLIDERFRAKSGMPEDLHQQLTKFEIRDLIEFHNAGYQIDRD